MTEPTTRRAFRIADLPSEERPRERLLRLGPAALSNEELLALLLRTGIPGESALDRARSLLAGRGGLVGLAGVSAAELAGERGIGPTRASAIAAAVEIARRMPAESLAGRDLLERAPARRRSSCARPSRTARRSGPARSSSMPGTACCRMIRTSTAARSTARSSNRREILRRALLGPRRRRHPVPQPSLGRPDAFPRRPRLHAPAGLGIGSRGRAAARPHRRRARRLRLVPRGGTPVSGRMSAGALLRYLSPSR